MSTRTIQITSALYEYLMQETLREPEVLEKLRMETAKLPMAGMQISPEQGQLMALLVELLGAKRTIEVGVFTGYSSTCVALALPDDGKIVACDVSEEWTSMAQRYWEEAGVAKKIDLHLAPATQTLAKLIEAGESGSYDFAFIDADKANYPEYYERCLELLRPGGLIAVDNALWHGAVANPEDKTPDTKAIRKVNRGARDDDRVTMCLLTVGDGLLLARKR